MFWAWDRWRWPGKRWAGMHSGCKSGCGNTRLEGPGCLPACLPAWCSLGSAHQHVRCLFPFPVFMSDLMAPLWSAVCWESHVSAPGLSPWLLLHWWTACPRAPPWVAPAFVLLGLCKKSTSSHPPPAKGQGNLGGLEILIYLPQSFPGAHIVHGSPMSGFQALINLSTSSSLFFIRMGWVQVSANIPRKSSLGLLIWSWNLETYLLWNPSSASKPCLLSGPPFLPLVSGSWTSPGWHDVMIA